MVFLIWAQDKNGGIGKNNKLPWHIKDEMKHFVNTTRNKIVVMGRKTFESIGRPLPNRINIVLTNNNTYKADGIIVYTDINKLINDYKNDDIYVIGGKQIYDAFSKYADTYIISFIHNSYDCDTFAPQIDNNFKLVSEDNSHPEFTIKTFKK